MDNSVRTLDPLFFKSGSLTDVISVIQDRWWSNDCRKQNIRPNYTQRKSRTNNQTDRETWVELIKANDLSVNLVPSPLGF